jgi:hypothetical protein
MRRSIDAGDDLGWPFRSAVWPAPNSLDGAEVARVEEEDLGRCLHWLLVEQGFEEALSLLVRDRFGNDAHVLLGPCDALLGHQLRD